MRKSWDEKMEKIEGNKTKKLRENVKGKKDENSTTPPSIHVASGLVWSIPSRCCLRFPHFHQENKKNRSLVRLPSFWAKTKKEEKRRLRGGGLGRE